MKILVTGGAGYIGSFMVRKLKSDGHEVVILDNLSEGHAESVVDFRLEKIDLVSQKEKVQSLLETEKFDGVIHMASFIQMGESFKDPGKYYTNNVFGFLNLLDCMVSTNTNNIILSSSAGVYGNPERLPVEENDKKDPLNPYGETKYMMERMLEDYDDAHGIKSISIRYFNAAGAAMDGSIGEAHKQESHLIPNIIAKAMKGLEVEIFGDDYDTEDGTCVRDYIHVLDIADNHALALEYLIKSQKSDVFNAGAGRGFSNKEILSEVEKVLGKEIKVKFGPKRPGDASKLFASIEKIQKVLGWSPKYNLEDIIKSAYLWHTTHPSGYKS